MLECVFHIFCAANTPPHDTKGTSAFSQKSQTASLQVSGSALLTAKIPPTHARRAKEALPRRKHARSHPGCTARTSIPPRASSKAHHRPATCSGRHHAHWLRSGSKRTLSRVGAEEQKVNHNVRSTCMLKTKLCKLAAHL